MLDAHWLSLSTNQKANRINSKTDLCSGSSFSTRGEIFLLIWSIDKYAGFNSWLYADPDNCKNFYGFSFAHQSEFTKIITLKTRLRIGPIYYNRNFSKIWRWITWFERYSNHEVLSRWECSMFRWYVPCRTLTIDKKLNICCYLWFVWNFNLSFMVFLVVNIDHTKVNDVARELYNRLGAFSNAFNFDEFINFT